MTQIREQTNLPLFDQQTAPLTAPVDPMVERNAKMQAAYDAANERFKEQYEDLLIRQFVMPGGEFTGEDVQNAFKSRPYLTQPREWRAVGNIYKRLVKDGVIVNVGYRKRNQGNPTPVYRKA